jgi:hypothetical protein
MVPLTLYSVTNTSRTDTSPRPELQDTGLTPVDASRSQPFPYSYIGSLRSASLNDPRHYTGITQTDYADPSRSPAASPIDDSGGSPSELAESPDEIDPAINPLDRSVSGLNAPPRPRFVSGVSAVSEGDRAHLRTISDTTVSSANTGGGVREGESNTGGLTAPNTTYPLRRSAFIEDRRDLNDG